MVKKLCMTRQEWQIYFKYGRRWKSGEFQVLEFKEVKEGSIIFLCVTFEDGK